MNQDRGWEMGDIVTIRLRPMRIEALSKAYLHVALHVISKSDGGPLRPTTTPQHSIVFLFTKNRKSTAEMSWLETLVLSNGTEFVPILAMLCGMCL